MADKLTPDELDAIEKAHIGILGGRDPNGDSEILNARIRCAFDCNQNGAIAHAHRAALLRHVEAMKQEATKREEGWREHVIDLHDKILTLEQEVERLRATEKREARRSIGAVNIWKKQALSQREQRKSAERKLARLVDWLETLDGHPLPNHIETILKEARNG